MKPVKAKPKLKLGRKRRTVVALGFDLSLASVAGAAKMKDGPLDKMKGPVWVRHPWMKETPHFEKLKYLARGSDFVHILLNELNAIAELPEIYIGVEDLPPRVMNANRYREQAELLGAFVGSLLRYGYFNVQLVNVKQWQALVAGDIGVKVNKDFDKWTVKNWAREVYDAPKWPDLIRSGKHGLIPKPKGSKAMPEQPDDRYDCTGIMDYVWDGIK